MYSETLTPRINQMFDDLQIQVTNIVKTQNNMKDAGNNIALAVASETTAKGKTMLNDMFAYLSDKLLESPDFSVVTRQNRFYELNLRNEILDKYVFETESKIDIPESSKVVNSLIASAGTAAIGGILVFALSPASPVVPVAVVVAASISAFCLSYQVIEPNRSKAKFTVAINTYLDEIRKQYLAWFDEVERFFNKRVNELKATF